MRIIFYDTWIDAIVLTIVVPLTALTAYLTNNMYFAIFIGGLYLTLITKMHEVE